MNRNDIDPPTIEPRLYIIMRSDIYDMTPGKLGAQSGHAASKFTYNMMIASYIDSSKSHACKSATPAFKEWLDGDRGFGTKITLAATQSDILGLTYHAEGEGQVAGTVIDTSYPFKNYFGKVFTAEELTCGYVFVTQDTPQSVLNYLNRFPLHT